MTAPFKPGDVLTISTKSYTGRKFTVVESTGHRTTLRGMRGSRRVLVLTGVDRLGAGYAIHEDDGERNRGRPCTVDDVARTSWTEGALEAGRKMSEAVDGFTRGAAKMGEVMRKHNGLNGLTVPAAHETGAPATASTDPIHMASALTSIAEHGYMSPKFTTPDEVIRVMDWMIDTARAGIDGEKFPDLDTESRPTTDVTGPMPRKTIAALILCDTPEDVAAWTVEQLANVVHGRRTTDEIIAALRLYERASEVCGT